MPTPVKWGGNRGPVSRLLLRAGPYLAPGTAIKSIYFGSPSVGPISSLCPGSCGQLACLGARACKRSCVCRSTCVRAIAGSLRAP